MEPGQVIALPLAAIDMAGLRTNALVAWMKRPTRAGLPVTRLFRISLGCSVEREGSMRALVLRTLSLGGLQLTEIRAATQDSGIELLALVTGEGVTETAVEQMILHLAAEPGVMRLTWSAVEEA